MSTLKDLDIGQSAVVQTVGCERSVRRRLLEMGLLPGTTLQVVRRAPMGDPVELRLRGYSLSIRGSDAAAIEVERCADLKPLTDAHGTAPASSSALSPAE